MTDPIKKRIQELVPEVMELKQGCILRNENGITGIVLYAHGSTNLCHVILYDNWTTQGDWNAVHCEILGSPITLAVVLRAIDAYSIDHDIDAAGALGVRPDTPNLAVFLIGEIVNLWNKSKDNYDDQSEETKAFIGKLLGV